MEERGEREEDVEEQPREDVEPADVPGVARGAVAAPPAAAAPGRHVRIGWIRTCLLGCLDDPHPLRAHYFSVLSNFAQSSCTAFAIFCGVVLPARRSWNWFCSVVYIDGEAQSV